MADLMKLIGSVLVILVVFAFTASFVSDANTANGGIYTTTYPSMAKVAAYTSYLQNASDSFHTQSIQNQAQTNGVLGQALNLFYGFLYSIAVAIISLFSFLDIGSSFIQDAGSYFVMVPAIILAIVGMWFGLKFAVSVANALKGGPI